MSERPSSRPAPPPLLSDWPDALRHSVEREAASWTEPDGRGVGEHVWDAWRARAIASGISDELAALGRLLMREAIVCGWDEDVRADCGVLDDGDAMIDYACADPDGAEQEWSELLEREGRR